MSTCIILNFREYLSNDKQVRNAKKNITFTILLCLKTLVLRSNFMYDGNQIKDYHKECERC